MRVVGYIREALDPREGEPAFAQSERIRRWATDANHNLVAICQDTRDRKAAGKAEGMRAVMGILAGGAAVAVVVTDLATLSPDKIVQEIVVRDLRSRGASVISIKEGDHRALENPTSDRVRTLVRDVLTRLDEHEGTFARTTGAPAESRDDDRDVDVIIEIVSAEPSEPVEWIRPSG